jgi:hypothetical protein
MTIDDRLNEFPEKVRERIIKNINDQKRMDYLINNNIFTLNLSEFLNSAFSFRDSNEGSDYWYEIIKILNSEGK